MTSEAHYFIAVPIKSSLKEKLANWNKREQPPFQRFVDQEDYHITLAFLGSVEPSIMRHLQVNLREISKKHMPFSLFIDDLGFFGQQQAPRVFWASVKKEEKLFQLQEDVFQMCVKLGFELDKRKYSPHITFARKYIGNGVYDEQHLKQSFQQSVGNESWVVSHFVIYQTHLKRTPKYEVIASFDLNE